MRTKNFLLLLLLHVAAIALLQALPMDPVKETLAERKESVAEDAAVTAGTRAAVARRQAEMAARGVQATDEQTSVAYSNIPVVEREAATASSKLSEETDEGLAQKVNEAEAAQKLWSDRLRELLSFQPMFSAAEAEEKLREWLLKEESERWQKIKEEVEEELEYSSEAKRGTEPLTQKLAAQSGEILRVLDEVERMLDEKGLKETKRNVEGKGHGVCDSETIDQFDQGVGQSTPHLRESFGTGESKVPFSAEENLTTAASVTLHLVTRAKEQAKLFREKADEKMKSARQKYDQARRAHIRGLLNPKISY